MPAKFIAKVAVPGPFLTPLDYLFPAGWNLTRGCRVEVNLRNRNIVGLVMDIDRQAECDPEKLKQIERQLDETAILSSQELQWLQWAADYYHEPIGEVIFTALPKRLRSGEAAQMQGQTVWRLSALGRELTEDELPKNAKAQKRVFNLLKCSAKGCNAHQLSDVSSSWRSVIKKFLDNDWVEAYQAPCMQNTPTEQSPRHELNSQQQKAVRSIIDAFGQFRALLLQGVTGSGKTEVYLGAIEAALQQGKQVLVLLPEIGLTPQMISRFEAYLGQSVAVMHSALNDSERHCAWDAIRCGTVSVLIGTRSAMFTPFKNLGLCIIDEEHDLSFKQQEGVRYSARDLLVRRAHQLGIPVVLGSATPALESLQNVHLGRYQYLQLSARAGKAVAPAIRLLDVRGEKVQEGVSAALKAEMFKHLQAGNQVLLFLNRRGFAPVLMCHDCGWQANCPSCDAHMTYHYISVERGGFLQCHHCGEQLPEPSVCPQCQSSELLKVGQGTERLQQAMEEWFPDKKVLRIDRDTTRLKGSLQEFTRQAESGEADILIGTQMLAKGHHFPKVTLVGVLDIDQGLFSCDFRASERMAQLLLQVSGRAGRAQSPGQVWIQTHHPTHPLLVTLIREGYSAFAEQALEERKLAKLPPFQYQIMVRAEAHDEIDVLNFLHSLKAGLEATQTTWSKDDSQWKGAVVFWGPVAAPMLRRQGRFRYQLLLQAPQRAQLHTLVTELLPHVYRSPLARKVRWSLDVDPAEMY
ncbi:primosomal protein N' [Thiomicrorhabdus heinhorstiae]|uniref:Replication restart protein PriA n=1 Tax=Thiomicrorhabdus heinhorstiae TaxID=2748010 RepID=A0ABS0BUC3_9GAMM|nr:primosomal protein N' [Thiomicrorhabdus heinhorstiae]MBF6057438.1 primosomal protein N' [Thiomicrorhabdus heinhorstiae]